MTVGPIDLSEFSHRVSVAEDILIDLRERLERTRWPTEPAATPWFYGTDLAYLRGVVDHWKSGYDWRRCETRLNGFAQYLIPIDGQLLYVVVEPGSGPRPRPLVLLNGWPSSIAEYLDVIGALAHPEQHGGKIEDAFTVIVPSYPGYSFSRPPAGPMPARDIARTLSRLMTEVLNHDRFFIHGGDWGATVGSWMAFNAPEHVIALHLNSAALRQPVEGLDLDPQEEAYLQRRADRLVREAGYQAIQGTKPQTLAYGLTDSPCGLAAWILEKFKAWVVPGTDEPPPFDLDRLLDNVMIYWINGINPANWLYCDLINGDAVTLEQGCRITVPTGLLSAGRDLPPLPPEAWIKRSYNLVHQRDIPSMGHFPFMEAIADIQIEELRSFFRKFSCG